MILFLHGNDSYRIHERANVLKDAFRTKFDSHGLNTLRMDGADFDIATLHTQLKTAGLFAQKRFVLLENVWELTAEQQETLHAELTHVDADTIFCVTAGEPPRKNNLLFKQLLKSDKVEEYNELTPVQLRTFIQNTCQSANATIAPDAVEYLAASVGTDLWRLHNELNKLIHFNSHVTLENVQQFVSASLDENIFHLTDALGNRNLKEASRLLNEQIESGANEQYVLTMLGRHLAALVKVKKTNGRGLTMHPYALKKCLAQSRRFSADQLAGLVWRVLEIDQKTKTRVTDTRILLDLLLVEACS